MHDAFVVRRGQSSRNLRRLFDGFTRWQRPAPDLLAQGLAFQQFRHQVRRALIGSHLEHGENVGMVQRRRRLRFLFKASQPLLVRREKGGQDFDRDVAPQPEVTGAIYLSHSSGPNQLLHFVVTQLGTRREGDLQSGGLKKTGASFVAGAK